MQMLSGLCECFTRVAVTGLETSACDLGCNFICEINQLRSFNCLSYEVINSPLLDRTAATGSTLKILMHELCMRCSFFSLGTE